MKLFDLLESPKLTVDQPVLGVQTAVDQHTPSPIGSGTSKREAKKKKVTMMGVPVVAESGPFSYGAKKPRKGSVADLAAQKRKEQEKGKQPAEPKDQRVGVARVVKEYGDTPKGQKMLTKVHKRAVDRTIRADDKNRLEPDYTKRDLKTVRKNQATADRAWDRFTDMNEQGVAEGDSGINKDQETKFHKKLDKLVHDTFGKRKGEMEEGTVQDKLYQRHQELRKKSGLPDPNYYKELKATYELPDEQRYKKTAELKKQYGVKEEVTETLGRAIPKMPKPRDPGNKILANKKNAAGKHIDKKQQQKRGIEKHRGLEIKTNLDLDEGWKSALAGAALAGATALGSPAYATEPVQQDITYVATIQTNDGLQKQINLGTNFNNNKEAYEYVDKFLKDRGIGVSFLNVAKVKTKPGEVQAKQPTQNQPQDANKDSNYLDTKPPTWKKGSGDYSEKGPYVATPTDKDYMQKMEEEKKGLYYYVNKRKKAGTSRPKDHPKAPSAQDWKDAAKTAKKNEDVSEDINESMERYLLQLRLAGYDIVQEEKVRLDPKCWKGKKIGKPKTKMKGGVRVNNCVPK